MNKRSTFERKIRVEGTLLFETAFHIGSGKEGELATNMGVLLEHDGRPILPGSTLKGKFRSLAERLAGHLGLGACLLDGALSGINCVSDEKYRTDNHEKYKAIAAEKEKLAWLAENTCDICKLFGSPMQSSRIFFADGELTTWARALQVRDGVCIDRDSETARPKAKYDFEVVPAGAEFRIAVELENPKESELALIGAVFCEWENVFRLGGFTSRGLGKARLSDKTVEEVNYADPDQLKTYLLERKMTPADDLFERSLKSFFEGALHA